MPPFLSARCRIAGHSIYISVLSPVFADKRVSMATISTGRWTNQVPGRSTYLSLPPCLSSFHCFPSFLFVISFSFSSPRLHRRLVRRSALQLWRHEAESIHAAAASRPVAFNGYICCTHEKRFSQHHRTRSTSMLKAQFTIDEEA